MEDSGNPVSAFAAFRSSGKDKKTKKSKKASSSKDVGDKKDKAKSSPKKMEKLISGNKAAPVDAAAVSNGLSENDSSDSDRTIDFEPNPVVDDLVKKATKGDSADNAGSGEPARKKSRKRRSECREEDNILDGDDVPLVEAVVESDFWAKGNGSCAGGGGGNDDDDDDDDQSKQPPPSMAVNGEAVMDAILAFNEEMESKRKKAKKGQKGRSGGGSKKTKESGLTVNGDGDSSQDVSENEFTKSLRKKFGLSEGGGGSKDDADLVIKQEQEPSAKRNKKQKGEKGGKGSSRSFAQLADNPASSSSSSSANGSIAKGRECLEWLINPVGVDSFFQESWEKRPLHIKRGQEDYYKHIFSTKAFDAILHGDKPVVYGKNLNVTSYTKGEGGGRETHDPVGRAYPPVVWDFYNSGCSLRMLNPQTFHAPVWKLCATLQEFFGSMVGANVYLTPPGTQGFAPHYDDVEVFILQLEGRKHWRVYEPLTAQGQLPRHSSGNFTQDEIGKPCLETVLEAGDMLYMPRGTIHQGNCMEDIHSLHITISAYQLNSFGDLLEKIVPVALQTAIEESVEFRQGLPINYLQHLGVAHSDSDTPMRREFMERIRKLMGRLFTYAPVDAAVDQMGKRLMRDSLPPYLTSDESARCVENGGEKWHSGKARVVNRVEISPDSEIRLIRANCLRLVTEDDASVRIYYNVDNSREIHEIDEQYLEIDADSAPAIEHLITSYPDYIPAESLPIEAFDVGMQVVQDLWEKKLLLTRQVLEATYDD